MTYRLSYAALVAVVAVGLAGCSKKQGAFRSSFFSTVPTPIETVGENVLYHCERQSSSEIHVVKNAKVTATPVLCWTEGSSEMSAAGQPVIFQERT